MKTREITMTFLQNVNVLQVTTADQNADLTASNVLVKAYCDGEKLPSFTSESRLLIGTDQKFKTAFEFPVLGNVMKLELTGEEKVIDQIEVIKRNVDPVSENDYWLMSLLIDRFKNSLGLETKFWNPRFEQRSEVMKAIKDRSADHYDMFEKWASVFINFKRVTGNVRWQKMHEGHWKSECEKVKTNLLNTSLELEQFCIQHKIQIRDVLNIAA